MLGIVSVHIPTRIVRVEGRYRTNDHMVRSYRRLNGENPSKDTAYIFGELLQITDPGICTVEATNQFLDILQGSGGWVIRPLEGDYTILETVQVLIPGDLEVFTRRVKAYLGNRVIIDDMSGPLPLREAPSREGGNLPDGKYMATQKREGDKLAILSVRESLTYTDAINRAREVIKERPYLQTEIAIAVGGWKPKKI